MSKTVLSKNDTVKVLYADDTSDKILQKLPSLLKKLEKVSKLYETYYKVIDYLFNKYGYCYIVDNKNVYKIVRKEWHSVRMRTVDLIDAAKWEIEALSENRLAEEIKRRKELKENKS